MATPKLLILVAFAAYASPTDAETTDMIFTVKGPVTKIPEGVSHEAGDKGTRVLRINQGQTGLLESTGKVMEIPADVARDTDELATQWWLWWLGYVPKAQGGMDDGQPAASAEDEIGIPAEPIAAEPVKKAKKAKAKAAEPAAEPAPVAEPEPEAPKAKGKGKKAPAAEPSRQEQIDARRIALAAMASADLRTLVKQATGKGIRPGTKAPDWIDLLIAREFPEPAAPVAVAPEKPAKGKKPAKPAAPAPGPGVGSRRPKIDFGPAFAGEKVVSATYNHREYGKCEYGVVQLADGSGFRLETFQGSRRDIKAGTTYRNADALMQALMGKPLHHMSIARFFRLSA